MNADETARQAARMLREIAAKLRAGARPLVTGAVGDLIKAGQELNAVMDAINTADAAKPRVNRAERRRRKR